MWIDLTQHNDEPMLVNMDNVIDVTPYQNGSRLQIATAPTAVLGRDATTHHEILVKETIDQIKVKMRPD